MAKTDELMMRIKETKAQIAKTKSKQRKYQLHRHLAKLWKERNRNENGTTHE